MLVLIGPAVCCAQAPIPDVPIDEVPVPSGGDDVKLDELGQTATELLLNLQKFSVIAAGKNILLNNNLDLVTSYQKLKDITDGNFSLHEDFIKRVLGKVKDEVKQHSKAIQLLEVLQAIRKEAQQSRTLIATAGVFSEPELAFFVDSYQQCYREAGHLIAEYLMVITDDDMKANDGERILLVIDIHQDAVNLYNSLRRFNAEMQLTTAHRRDVAEQSNRVMTLFGIEP